MITLSPSRAHRWVNCPASAELEKKYHRPAGPAAAEGTLAHKIAHNVLQGYPLPDDIDPEMRAGVTLYVDEVRRSIISQETKFEFEQKISRKDLKRVSITGTPDVWIYDRPKRTLEILDFKYGFSQVEVIKNWQMLAYAYLVRPMVHRIERIRLTIVQPRAYHPNGPVRSWLISMQDYEEYAKKISEVLRNLNLGRKWALIGAWCRYCNALPACYTMAKTSAAAMDLSEEPLDFELSDEQLASELNHTEEAQRVLSHRMEALEEYAIRKIQAGAIIPGWDLAPGRGTLAWNRPTAEVASVMDMMGVDVRKPVELITPKQAENAGLDTNILQHYTTKKQGKIKLKRSDVDLGRKVFGGK